MLCRFRSAPVMVMPMRPVMVVRRPVDVAAMIVPGRRIIAGRRVVARPRLVAPLGPAVSVPDRTADHGDIFNESALRCGDRRGAAGEGLRAAACERAGNGQGCGQNQTTHVWEFLSCLMD